MRRTKQLFRRWAHCRDGTITRVEMLRLMEPIHDEISPGAPGLHGVFSGNSKPNGLCEPLSNHREKVRTFLDVDGVEPTNIVRERALHPAAVWRKLSFGTQSANGSRFVETILTVVEPEISNLAAASSTLLKQSRHTSPVKSVPHSETGCERLPWASQQKLMPALENR